MSAARALSPSAGHRTGPIVAAIRNPADLPLVLVAAAQADRRGAALVLVHVTVPRPRCGLASGRRRAVVRRDTANGRDPNVALRDRALTLAGLGGVEVTWLSAIGFPDDVVARFCRDNCAALIVVGASRRQLATWRRHRVLAAARRLKRRARTPIHIATT